MFSPDKASPSSQCPSMPSREVLRSKCRDGMSEGRCSRNSNGDVQLEDDATAPLPKKNEGPIHWRASTSPKVQRRRSYSRRSTMYVLGLSRMAHDGVLAESSCILRHHRGRHAHLPLLLFRVLQHLGRRPTPAFSFLVPPSSFLSSPSS
jgi:hypothetical protein